MPIYGPESLLRNIEYPWEGLGGSFGVVFVEFWWICLVLGGSCLALLGPYWPLLAPIGIHLARAGGSGPRTPALPLMGA